MMQKLGDRYTLEREKALGEAIRDVASELRLIDAADFIAFLRTEQFANIRSLVNSSTELFFKPGTVTFGLSGHVEVTWSSNPAVVLDMEFEHKSVRATFRLMLEALQAGVEIDQIAFEDGSSDPDENTERLIDAIADARLMPIAEPIYPARLSVN
jgi:hypothetical protein